jgi:dolichyl-phosphate beta-glucosyltransferase
MRDLSIIIPTLNESSRILNCLMQFAKLYPREILVVDNGSTDGTLDTVERWQRQQVLPCELRVFSLPVPGKGLAVRTGMLEARGEYRYMADCDLSTPAEAVLDFLLMMRTFRADVVIGSRRLLRSRVTQSAGRAFTGEIFHALTSLVLPAIQDTQCGFKLFRWGAAEAIFSSVMTPGLAFDVEVLLEARRLGLEVLEIPVTWVEGTESRVHPLRDGLRMAADVASLARRYRNRRMVTAVDPL